MAAEQMRSEPGRCVRAAWLGLLALLFFMLSGSARAEKAGTEITGYFENTVFLRPAMVKTTEYVDSMPAYTVLTMKTLDDTWAEYTSPRGITGYVNWSRMLPVPEWEKDPERYVYGEKRIEVRSLPVYEAPTVYAAQPRELLTVTGHIKGFLRVAAADGTEGYIFASWVKDAVFTPKPIRPVTLCGAEGTEILDLPLEGAHRMGTLQPEQLYISQGTCGNYYALETDGETRYVAKDRVAVLNSRIGEDRDFFSLPKVKGKKRTDTWENLYANAVIGPRGAEMHLPGGETIRLEPEERVYVYTAYGSWAGAVWKQQAGYLLRSEMEILTGETLTARLQNTDLSGGRIRRNALLDQAFAMVEEGNPFQARYNLLTGAEIRSLFPLGVPYFWGGRSYSIMTERFPAYTTREAWQSSPVFYQQGTVYLYGFDCIGFVKSVYHLAGRELKGTVVGRRAEEYCRAGQHIYCDDVHPLPEDWREAARTMQVGDVMVIHHPGTHAMMFMGTLRDYGYTEEQLPALARYLDHPLMLHCGANPYTYWRFQSLIEGTADRRISGASPTDGGVGVCILGVDPADAEIILEAHEESYRCFDVEGACVTMMGFGNVKDYFVWRMGAADPGPREEDGTEADPMEAAGDEADAPETVLQEILRQGSPEPENADAPAAEPETVLQEILRQGEDTTEYAGTPAKPESRETDPETVLQRILNGRPET